MKIKDKIKDKINRACQLEKSISNLNKFIEQAEMGGTFYQDNQEKENKHYCLELCTRVWTGSDTCDYRSKVYEPDIINLLVESSLPTLKSKVVELQAELENLFN